MRLLPLALLAACGSDTNPATCDPTLDKCTGSNICLVSTCESAFPLTYSVFQVHAEATEAHDLQVLFAVGDLGDPPTIVAMTPVVTGSAADFDGAFSVDFNSENDAFLVELKDAATGDLLLACAREPVDMNQLRRRDDNCDKEGYRLSYEIVPAPSADGRR